MAEITPKGHLKQLLSPLIRAGWGVYTSPQITETSDSTRKLYQTVLKRSCMVLGVKYEPEPEQLRLVSVAEQLKQPNDDIGLHDAVTGTKILAGVIDELTPFAVEGFVGPLGLLDPTRYLLPADLSAHGMQPSSTGSTTSTSA
jgi:hypothetical protein